jgi:hypothetical protein
VSSSFPSGFFLEQTVLSSYHSSIVKVLFLCQFSTFTDKTADASDLLNFNIGLCSAASLLTGLKDVQLLLIRPFRLDPSSLSRYLFYTLSSLLSRVEPDQSQANFLISWSMFFVFIDLLCGRNLPYFLQRAGLYRISITCQGIRFSVRIPNYREPS